MSLDILTARDIAKISTKLPQFATKLHNIAKLNIFRVNKDFLVLLVKMALLDL